MDAESKYRLDKCKEQSVELGLKDNGLLESMKLYNKASDLQKKR